MTRTGIADDEETGGSGLPDEVTGAGWYRDAIRYAISAKKIMANVINPAAIGMIGSLRGSETAAG